MLHESSLSSLLLNDQHYLLGNNATMQKPSSDLSADPTMVNSKHGRDQFDEEKLDSKKSKMTPDEGSQKPAAQGGDEKSLDAASDDGSDEDGLGGGNESDDSEHDMFKKFRREKRLAMNRASARARRRKKKVMLETLTHQVTELTKKNISLQGTNETLIRKVERLEASLGQARETIASLLEGRQGPPGVGLSAAAATVLPSSLSPSLLPGTGLVGSNAAGAAAALGAAGPSADPFHSLLFGAGAGAGTAAAGGGSLFGARDPVYTAALQQQRVQQMLALRARASGGLLPDDTSTLSSSLMRSSNQPNAALAGFTTEGGIQSALRLAQIPGATQRPRGNLNDDSEGKKKRHKG